MTARERVDIAAVVVAVLLTVLATVLDFALVTSVVAVTGWGLAWLLAYRFTAPVNSAVAARLAAERKREAEESAYLRLLQREYLEADMDNEEFGFEAQVEAYLRRRARQAATEPPLTPPKQALGRCHTCGAAMAWALLKNVTGPPPHSREWRAYCEKCRSVRSRRYGSRPEKAVAIAMARERWRPYR